MKKKAADRPIEKVWGFCPRCGAKAAKKGVNPFHCQECEYTHYFGPCAAVGAITTDLEGRVLLLIRGKDPGKGMYGLPGGFVDQGKRLRKLCIGKSWKRSGSKLSSIIIWPRSRTSMPIPVPYCRLWMCFCDDG